MKRDIADAGSAVRSLGCPGGIRCRDIRSECKANQYRYHQEPEKLAAYFSDIGSHHGQDLGCLIAKVYGATRKNVVNILSREINRILIWRLRVGS